MLQGKMKKKFRSTLKFCMHNAFQILAAVVVVQVTKLTNWQKRPSLVIG